MKLLAIDCAAGRLALAAVDDGRSSAAETLVRAHCRITTVESDGGAAASAHAVPGLLDLLRARGWTFADLDAIAFGRGPGAFTGLRTACAVAQGIAFGRALPAVPVDSLALVAEDASMQIGEALPAGAAVWVAMDARMQEIYAGCYTKDEGEGWTAVVAPALMAPDELLVRWRIEPPAVVAGSALEAFGTRLDTGIARRVPSEQARAQALGWLAACGLARGDAVDPAQALPVYVRDKVALTTAERAAVRAACA